MRKYPFLLVLLFSLLSANLFIACHSSQGINKLDPVYNPSPPPPPVVPSTNGRLDITVTTRTYTGVYPAYVLAAWIETSAGVFVKSVRVYGAYTGPNPVGVAGYLPALVDWIAAGGEVGPTGNIDGWAGATRSRAQHGPVSAVWDIDNRSDVRVPDGNYNLQVEFTEDNAHLTGTANTKNAVLRLSITGTNVKSFSTNTTWIDISATYTPPAN